MHIGEHCKITIEPEGAYGKKVGAILCLLCLTPAQGVPGKIPPNSTLIFEVELLNIV